MTGALAATPDPGAARRAARSILSEQRFRPEHLPRPLEGVLRWIGDRFAPVGDFLGKAFGPVLDFSGTTSGMVVVGLVLAVAVGMIARMVARRRLARERRVHHDHADLEHFGRDPRELERAADDAEARGELALAIRLRFRAGLLRLDEQGVIAFRPSLPTRAVARRLDNATFDRLAREFDFVAYGFHEPSLDEIAVSKQEWQQVLAEVGRR